MARIRSVHPGLFTDESIVSLTPLARFLLIGLWTEADDNGAFEWKPITLKMKLLPADNVDISALLSEIASVNCIKRVDIEGQDIGLIRNFMRYQRPKFPKIRFTIPADLRRYVGSREPAGVIDRDDEGDFPRIVEMSPQRERRREWE
jgi:hypothetical protein